MISPIFDELENVEMKTTAFSPKIREAKIKPVPIATNATLDKRREGVVTALQLMTMNRKDRRRYGKQLGFRINGSSKPLTAK